MELLAEDINWLVKSYDPAAVQKIAEEANLPLPLAAILQQKGITDPKGIADFLHPHLGRLPSPVVMNGMQPAVEIVAHAMSTDVPILVYGDYDVDGATGIAVIVLFLRQLGVQRIGWCQPHRLRNGYGLHEEVVLENLDKAGAKPGVLITVDCGITDHDQIARLKGRGFKIIVTDHHQPQANLPPAEAILNPLQPGCAFPGKSLAGVGVAFYFMMGLRAYLREKGFFAGPGDIPILKDYLDLVALGTIADMVPLEEVNRILVKAGLEVMGEKKRPCFKALTELHYGNCRLPVVPEDVSFRFAPLLNAASRLGDGADALQFLITEDEGEAGRLLRKLNETNLLRRKITSEVFAEAREKAAELVEKGYKTIVLASEQWHQGVIGIVASQLVNQFHRPSIIFSVTNGIAKGSGRSTPEIDLFEKMGECSQFYTQFGGHRAAVGVTLAAEGLSRFQEQFERIVGQAGGGQGPVAMEQIDWHSSEGSIFADNFLRYYQLLEPFGIGNPEPVFACTGAIRSSKKVGTGHLKFILQKNGWHMDGIGFNLGDKFDQLDSLNEYQIVFRLSQNTFQGKRSWQLNTLAINKITI